MFTIFQILCISITKRINSNKYYCCKLKINYNYENNYNRMFCIKFVEVPSPPGKPEPSEVTDDSVTLHWKEPETDGNSPIIEYILEYHDREELS